MSTRNNFHSSTILLILSLGCNSDDSFLIEDWVDLLFFFKGLRHPSCLSKSFFKGNFDWSSATVILKKDRIPSIAYFCWSCDTSLRAFLVSTPMTMSLSDNCSSISLHSIDARSHQYFLSVADLTFSEECDTSCHNMWTTGHSFWNSNKNSSKTGKTSQVRL